MPDRSLSEYTADFRQVDLGIEMIYGLPDQNVWRGMV